MFADNARGSGNAPWMALPTICAWELAVNEHHRSIRDSLLQPRWRYVFRGRLRTTESRRWCIWCSGRQDRTQIDDSRTGQVEFRSGRILMTKDIVDSYSGMGISLLLVRGLDIDVTVHGC